MGRYKPGISYTYETVSGVVYAREDGAPENERFEIGREYSVTKQPIDWYRLLETAKTNTALQDAVDKCIMIYTLSKEYDNGI